MEKNAENVIKIKRIRNFFLFILGFLGVMDKKNGFLGLIFSSGQKEWCLFSSSLNSN